MKKKKEKKRLDLHRLGASPAREGGRESLA